MLHKSVSYTKISETQLENRLCTLHKSEGHWKIEGKGRDCKKRKGVYVGQRMT